MDGGDVAAAVAEMLRVLVPAQDLDWGVRAGLLEWTCTETAAHVAHDLTAYATQLAGRVSDAYLPLDLTVPPGTAPAGVLRVVASCGAMLGAVLHAAGPDARAWHWGPADPSGFAAMGVNETLVHTWDVTQGLGIGWSPPADLAAGVLTRLFPDAPSGDPGEVLLWCTGRIALPGHPRRTEEWRMRVARG
ncbi:MAG TPA: maleylpyruvate isomerase N-terminal domain-containing protein [Actinoplanes sp.]|nr:maleylpyruvate isomerase N-terminal domain-containing protein [Actinoplanes sp.]